VIKLKTHTGTDYYIQATTWRNKKQVFFLSNYQVGFGNGITVKRHMRGKEVCDFLQVFEHRPSR
jgi:hypothetical protein